jgi:hypothetical protein
MSLVVCRALEGRAQQIAADTKSSPSRAKALAGEANGVRLALVSEICGLVDRICDIFEEDNPEGRRHG